jgi:hypothetical protein
MARLTTPTLILLCFATPVFATAQSGRNAREAVNDHRQIALDRAWSLRDASELTEFETLVSTLHDANEDRMVRRYREINARLQTAMDREISQTHVKRGQAANEQRKSRRELRGERMEAGQTGDPRDQLGVADDRRDLNDDRRDRRSTASRGEEMARLGTLAGSLQNDVARGDRAAMERNLKIATEFLALMRADAEANWKERAEDRRELREDRRERRTDSR